MEQTRKEPFEARAHLLSRPALVISAVSALLAFLATVYGCIQLFSPDFRARLIEFMVRDGILQRSAQKTWFLVDVVLRVLQLFLTASLAAVNGYIYRSVRLSSDGAISLKELRPLALGARILAIVEYLLGGVLAVLFVLRVVAYGMSSFRFRGGGYDFFTMLVVEVVCLLALFGGGLWFHRFLSSTVDASASLQRIFLSRILAGRAIDPFFVRSILTFSILWLIVGLYRAPDWVGAASAFLLSISLFSSYRLLRNLKNEMEWLEYLKNKEKN